jgi:hypothetical protein
MTEFEKFVYMIRDVMSILDKLEGAKGVPKGNR